MALDQYHSSIKRLGKERDLKIETKEKVAWRHFASGLHLAGIELHLN